MWLCTSWQCACMLQYACTGGLGCVTSSCVTSKPLALCTLKHTAARALRSSAADCRHQRCKGGHISAGLPVSASAQAGGAQAGSVSGSTQTQNGASPWNLLAAMVTLPVSYISGGSEVALLTSASHGLF